MLQFTTNPRATLVAITASGVTSLSTVTITVDPSTIPKTAVIVLLNFGTGGTVTLPDAATWAALHTENLVIKDISGNAGTNAATITAAGANTIDGQSSVVIGMNYGCLQLRVSPSNNWLVISLG